LDALNDTPDLKRKGKLFSVKFCPKCGSNDVFWAQGMPQFWSMWDCRNCGYRGPVILEDGNLAEQLQRDWKNKKQEPEKEKQES
jgi:DNA-directed RNA polymerase subunit M